jgi:gliding motility-associated protein GldE
LKAQIFLFQSVQQTPSGMLSSEHAVGVLIFLISLIFIYLLILWVKLSFLALTTSDLTVLRELPGKASRSVYGLLENPNRFLGAVRIAGFIFSVGIVVCCVWFLGFFIDLQTLNIGIVILISLSVAVVLFLLERASVKIISGQARFLALGLSGIAVVLDKLFGFAGESLPSVFPVSLMHEMKKKDLTLEEMTDVLDISDPSKENNIFEGVVHFRHTDVREILTPRMDVISVEISMPLEEVMTLVMQSGYSRIPVYEKSLDQIKGILYVKDLLPYLVDNTHPVDWQSLLRTPFFVPDTKHLYPLLREFQKNKTQLAVVVDEYGGTAGIVTLEDILEEIVGEIADESDHDDQRFSILGERIWLFNAKISLNDFCRVIGEDEDFFDKIKGEADTLAGLILEMNGEIPVRGDELEYGPYVFRIESVDERRIDQIKVMAKLPG